jgi:hypothetical protein
MDSRAAHDGKTPRLRPSPSAIVAYAAHGLGFLALAAAALVHFGQVFWVPALVIIVVSEMSLREAWLLLKRRLANRPH